MLEAIETNGTSIVRLATEVDRTGPDLIEILMRRGWRHWNKVPDANGQVLVLCPEADFPNVPNGTLMESIGGERAVKGQDDIDLDTRCGLIAYGVRVDPGQYGVA